MIKAGPSWSHMQAIAHTLPYDIMLCDSGSADTAWVAKISVPVLALAGGASPGWAPEAVRAIAATAAHAQYRILEGQDHGPAAEVLVPVLKEFFA